MTDIFNSPGPEPVRVAVLGSTGSIGRQALDVVRSNPGRFRLTAVAGRGDCEGLLAQAKEFEVGLIGIAEGPARDGAFPDDLEVITGPDSAEVVAQKAEADIVLNAVMGAAGLKATLATLAAGKTLALANKESLVAAGELVMAKAAPGQIRPVDSEHSALWQILQGLAPDEVRKAVLTGSGGPFRGKSRSQLAHVTADQALEHPVWDMGAKITIDSATLMNKGLEVIEAHFLFGFTYDEVEVVIHPEGLIHAMAETMDGAVFCHAAYPDMRLPIQLALAWPERLGPPGGKRIDWSSRRAFTFEEPDADTFRCLSLALEAGRKGDTFPAVLNAANEVAVKAFLEQRIGFLKIAETAEEVLNRHEPEEPVLEAILEADRWARAGASRIVERSQR